MWDVAHLPGVLDPLNAIADVTLLPPDQQVLLNEIEHFDIYLTALKTRSDKEVLARAKRLKVILTPSTGLDHIDMQEAKSRGIKVLHIRHDYDMLKKVTATAEMAWALMLAAQRKLPAAAAAANQGYWGRDTFRGHQVAYQTLGILGYGRLGEIVADYGKAFRMNVLACDLKEFSAPGVRRVDFETLLRESDVLSIHIHLTEENRGLIGRQQLAMMKPGSVLVNTSRGAIIDEEALVDALNDGPLRAAGLDVVHGEWDANLYDHPLIRHARTHDNLVIVPHLGGITHESQRISSEHCVQKLLTYLKDKRP
jgi:D-3-phosphoglycerate dehydrogenase